MIHGFIYNASKILRVLKTRASVPDSRHQQIKRKDQAQSKKAWVSVISKCKWKSVSVCLLENKGLELDNLRKHSQTCHETFCVNLFYAILLTCFHNFIIK